MDVDCFYAELHQLLHSPGLVNQPLYSLDICTGTPPVGTLAVAFISPLFMMNAKEKLKHVKVGGNSKLPDGQEHWQGDVFCWSIHDKEETINKVLLQFLGGI